MKHHIETKRVVGLNPGNEAVLLKESGQPLAAYLDARAVDGWEVLSVSAIGHLEVLITYRQR